MLQKTNRSSLAALLTTFPVLGLIATTALADIEVAFVGPITGQVAALGEQGNQGAKRAVEDINAAGGINGEKLVLAIGDDACDPKQAVNVANQMASKGVKFVAGHLCSGASIPASKVYEDEGILMITPRLHQPQADRRRRLERCPCLRPRRCPGQGGGRLHRQSLCRQEGGHHR